MSDVRQIRITGLEGLPFLDKVQNLAEQPPSPDAIAVTAETDRVYLGTSARPSRSTTRVGAVASWWRREGSATTVVWNPWVAKAAAMPDFGDDEWTGMVCIEAANVRENAVTVRSGAIHSLATQDLGGTG